MSLPETITLDVPNLLAAAGILISLLAAFVAARSARSAQRQADAAEQSVAQAQVQTQLAQAALKAVRQQNAIAGHGNRLEVYKALVVFEGEMNATGVGFADAPIWELWRHDQTAEFYFSAKTSKALSDFVEEALKNKDMHRAWNEDRFALERREQVNATAEHFKKLRERFKALNAAMRQELKIAHDEDMSP